MKASNAPNECSASSLGLEKLKREAITGAFQKSEVRRMGSRELIEGATPRRSQKACKQLRGRGQNAGFYPKIAGNQP